MPQETIDLMMQFGVAGLMGVLWVWERTTSRKREAQLSESHERLMRDRIELAELMALVDRNTRAIDRFDATQQQLSTLFKEFRDESNHRAA